MIPTPTLQSVVHALLKLLQGASVILPVETRFEFAITNEEGSSSRMRTPMRTPTLFFKQI